MDRELISIIIPVYNVEMLLTDCINSVLNQDYRNIEVILINDGSTDNSGEVCKSFEKKDNRIKVFEQKNSGVSVARNKGVEKAQGKYIIFVDSDDYLDVNHVSKMYSQINDEIDLVICGYKIIDNDTHSINLNADMQDSVLNPQEMFLKYWENYHHGYINAPWNKMYKRELMQQNNIKFPKDISMGEDGFFNVQYMKCCRKIYLLAEYSYNFRIHSRQSTKKIFKNHYYMVTCIFDNLERILETYNIMTKEEFLDTHYKNYLDEIKMSVKYILRDNSLNFKDKIENIKIISVHERTGKMIVSMDEKTLGIKNKFLIAGLKYLRR